MNSVPGRSLERVAEILLKPKKTNAPKSSRTEQPALRLEPLVHETLQKRVYDKLRSAFLTSQFLPGQTLTMRALASMTGTSVQPVREAMQRLCAEGALEWLPNTAFRVPDIDPDRYRELWSLRRLLEGEATRRASEKITPAELAELRQINRQMRAAMRAGDASGTLTRNRDFHFAIYRAAQSPLLVGLIEMIWMQVSPLFAAFTRHELGLPDSGLGERLPAAAADFFALQDLVIEALSQKKAANAVGALDQVLELSAHLFGNHERHAGEASRSLARKR
jgi:DNA-binding GntR family transcriptional regulator